MSSSDLTRRSEIAKIDSRVKRGNDKRKAGMTSAKSKII